MRGMSITSITINSRSMIMFKLGFFGGVTYLIGQMFYTMIRWMCYLSIAAIGLLLVVVLDAIRVSL